MTRARVLRLIAGVAGSQEVGLVVVGWEVFGCPGWPTVSRSQVHTPACDSCHIPALAEWPSLPLTGDIAHIRDIMILPRLPAGGLQRPSAAAHTSSRVDPSETILLSLLSGGPPGFPPYGKGYETGPRWGGDPEGKVNEKGREG